MHAQQLEAPEHVQVEERVRVPDPAIATRPPGLPPQVEGPHHQFRGVGRAVVQSRNVAWLESTGPVSVFQLTSQAPLTLADPGECEEAILEVTRQNRTVLLIGERLSLSVQHDLDSLDNLVPMGEEEMEQFDV